MKIEEALRIAAEAKVRPRRQLAIASPEKEGAEPAAALHGYFRKGSAGGPGRPLGSRNRLGKAFVDELFDSWQKGHGRRALLRLAGPDCVLVAFGGKRTSTGKQDRLAQSRMTQRRHCNVLPSE